MEVHTEKHIRRINKINRDACGFGVVSQRFLASLYQVVEFVSVAPVLEHNPVRAPIIRVTLNEFECSFFVLACPATSTLVTSGRARSMDQSPSASFSSDK